MFRSSPPQRTSLGQPHSAVSFALVKLLLLRNEPEEASKARQGLRERGNQICLLSPILPPKPATRQNGGHHHGAEEHQKRGELERWTKAVACNIKRQGWMLNMKQPTYPRAKIGAPGTPAGSWDDATFFMYLLRSSMAPWILSFKHSCLSSCITQCFPTCALMHLQSTALTTVNRPVD